MRKRSGEIKTCSTCGNSFYTKPFRAKTQKFCSIKCRPQVWNKGLTKADPRVMTYIVKVAQAHKGKRVSRNTEFVTGDKRISGESHWNWKGGVHLMNKGVRQSIMSLGIYKNWRKAVFERDNFTCCLCSKRGGILHADHIKPFSLHPELIVELSNGRTLCSPCHRKTDTWGARLNSYAQNL